MLLRSLASVLHLGAIDFERVEIKDQATTSANISANYRAESAEDQSASRSRDDLGEYLGELPP